MHDYRALPRTIIYARYTLPRYNVYSVVS
ncbi:hypothetical protein GMOD_00002445 [Pyrenophora seminiperda CCB06]|uniref:Uncharacterized protein n=1 Tax=Pyrenophora seminiperda CCB06 TaxID=1302712 RepID=A0A3M7M2F8_9PLEO|nr:hypothetical protein GMOD_00002445 [Pyrenophora seminiperda CCB06]